MRLSSITHLLLCFSTYALRPTTLQKHREASALRNKPHHGFQLRYEIPQLKATDKKLPLADGDTNEKSNLSGKKIVMVTAIGSLLSVTFAAKVGILPLPAGTAYTDTMIREDLRVTLLVGIAGVIFVKFCTLLASKNVLQPRDSRKLIHITTALVYMLFWPFFSTAGRYFAMCVPLVNAVRLYMASTGTFGEEELANAISRTGDKKEAVGGPFIYVIVLLFSVLLFWRDNMIGISALSTMAAGDGMADIVGRRLGKRNKWFFAESKSVAGTVAFILFSFLAIVGLTSWFSATGCLDMPDGVISLIPRIIAVCSGAALVELLPIADDNWTVPASSAILAALFLNIKNI